MKQLTDFKIDVLTIDAILDEGSKLETALLHAFDYAIVKPKELIEDYVKEEYSKAIKSLDKVALERATDLTAKLRKHSSEGLFDLELLKLVKALKAYFEAILAIYSYTDVSSSNEDSLMLYYVNECIKSCNIIFSDQYFKQNRSIDIKRLEKALFSFTGRDLEIVSLNPELMTFINGVTYIKTETITW